MVARPQTAVGHPCTRRTVFQPCLTGCNHRSVPVEWPAPNPDAALLAIVHATARAHTFHHRGFDHTPICTQCVTDIVFSVSAWRGTRTAPTLACTGKPL